KNESGDVKGCPAFKTWLVRDSNSVLQVRFRNENKSTKAAWRPKLMNFLHVIRFIAWTIQID
ncbi:MAG TPA: hypothetical protein VFZ52_08170, partial [Chryseolinea sp.]